MIYFAAAILQGLKEDGFFHRQLEEEFLKMGLRSRLISFADVNQIPGAFRFWLHPEPKGKRLFLDSGAYSAASRGAVIDLSQYIDYIRQNEPNLFCFCIT